MQTLSNEDEFNLHENETLGETQFYMSGFAGRLVLTERQKAKGNSERDNSWAFIEGEYES